MRERDVRIGGESKTDLLQVGHSRRDGGWPFGQVEDWQAMVTALMFGGVGGGCRRAVGGRHRTGNIAWAPISDRL